MKVGGYQQNNKAFKSDSQRLAFSRRSSIAKRCSHLNAALCLSTYFEGFIMGRAKEEMMLRDELQPMYDWIEDNYGDDAGEEGSDEWEEAVTAYEDYVEHQQRQQELDWYLQEELEWFINDQSQIGVFDNQIRSILNLLSVSTDRETQFSLLVMLHGHTVASVEAYLASTFIHKVTNSDKLIRKLVETDPVFAEMTFTMKDIYKKHEGLKLTVADYLKNLIFHRLDKIKPMYKSVLDCDFGNISWLFSAVKVRHDCVHRAGWDNNGNKVAITTESVKELVTNSRELVHRIEHDLQQQFISELIDL
ncbi:hypothetical protein DZF72_28965 [Vibrio parahaemolyticus]|nr:hypothetical protein [Vibrio parahaemolyticus]